MTKRGRELETEAAMVLAALQQMPTQIARVVRGCTVERLHEMPARDAWSARDILAHLRACAEVWGRSIDRMLAEERPTIRHVSPRGWIRRTDYLDQTFRDSLRAFTQGRDALCGQLRELDVAGWVRSAKFTGTTLGRDGTVLSYARRIADHERGHLDQLRRTVRK